MTMRPDCPRCKEPITSAEEHRLRAGLTGSNIPKSNASLSRPNYYEKDSEGNDWWMCPVCGLLWVPATGRRNGELGLPDDTRHGKATTKSGSE